MHEKNMSLWQHCATNIPIAEEEDPKIYEFPIREVNDNDDRMKNSNPVSLHNFHNLSLEDTDTLF